MNSRSMHAPSTVDRSLIPHHLRHYTAKRKDSQQQALTERTDDPEVPVRILSSGVRSFRLFDRASSSRSLKAFRKERNKEPDTSEEPVCFRSRFSKDRQVSNSSLGSIQTVDSIANLLRRINFPGVSRRIPAASEGSIRTVDSIDLRMNQLQPDDSGLSLTSHSNVDVRAEMHSHDRDDDSILSVESFMNEDEFDDNVDAAERVTTTDE